jgi:hypothetical protein
MGLPSAETATKAPPLGLSTLCRAFSLDSRGPDLDPKNSTAKKRVTLYGKNILYFSKTIQNWVTSVKKNYNLKCFEV